MSGEEMTAKEYSDYCLRLEGRKEELLHWLEFYDNIVSEIEKNDMNTQFTYPIFALLRELVSERLDKVEGELAVGTGTTRSRFFMEEEE